jgi:hypothetical protein
MAKKLPTLLSLTAALAAMMGGAALGTTPATANTATGADEANATRSDLAAKGEPNVFVPVGNDLLGLIVTKGADGTVLADHYSHVSHSSHASHRSHYSSVI